MKIFNISINYLKRIFTNPFLVILILAGSLLETFLVSSNINSASSSITDSISQKYTEVMIIGVNKTANINQLLCSSTLAYFLLITAIIMVGLNISDRKNKTFMRMYSCPVKKSTVILGNIIGQFLITFIVAVFYMFFSSIIFKISYGNSLVGIFIVTIFAVYLSASFGFFMSGLFKNSTAGVSTCAFILFFLALFSDSFSLSGDFDATSKFTLNKWIYESYYSLMQENPLSSITQNLIVLMLLGTLFNVLGILLYKREKTYE